MSQKENGTDFPAEWEFLPSLRRVVSDLLTDRFSDIQKRVKIKYRHGWEESGYISRSTGSIRIPIVVHSRASTGGGPMGLDVAEICETRKPYKVLWSLEKDEPAAWVHLA